jgi:hypothetical protein
MYVLMSYPPSLLLIWYQKPLLLLLKLPEHVANSLSLLQGVEYVEQQNHLSFFFTVADHQTASVV